MRLNGEIGSAEMQMVSGLGSSERAAVQSVAKHPRAREESEEITALEPNSTVQFPRSSGASYRWCKSKVGLRRRFSTQRLQRTTERRRGIGGNKGSASLCSRRLDIAALLA